MPFSCNFPPVCYNKPNDLEENAMKKNGLYCASKVGGTYVYKRPCQPYSMCVNDEGFDSYVEVVLDESKCVESISWNAYTE